MRPRSARREAHEAFLRPQPRPTVFRSQRALLLALRDLHVPGGWDCDVTYSKGHFYRNPPIEVVRYGDLRRQNWLPLDQPHHRFDLHPQAEGVVGADCRRLPLRAASVRHVMFDPPFMHATGETSRMGQRFGSYRTQAELRQMYEEALAEFWRVVRPGGTVTFKCQDTVEAQRQQWTHMLVWRMAERIGFVTIDMAVLEAERTMEGHNHGRQQHLRRRHSYFFVFKKLPTAEDQPCRRPVAKVSLKLLIPYREPASASLTRA